MGAGTALYSATTYASGKYSNGKPYLPSLSSVVGLSGWLPCAKYFFFPPQFQIRPKDIFLFKRNLNVSRTISALLGC